MNAPLELPPWMTEKLAKIAATFDDDERFWSSEQEEVSILTAAIRNFPEEAKILPADFRERVARGKPRELPPLERSAIILTAYDWRNVCDVWKGATLEDKIAAQFGALAFALQQGGAE